MKNQKLRNLSVSALIAALYVVLTYVSSAMGLASGAVQVRLSELLTILPVFTFAAVPGLAVGCAAANLLTGCALWDVVFGSLATLIGAIGTYYLRRHKLIAVLPPIAANIIVVPLVLRYVYLTPGALPFLALTVGAGEVISCGILGTAFRKLLERTAPSLLRMLEVKRR